MQKYINDLNGLVYFRQVDKVENMKCFGLLASHKLTFKDMEMKEIFSDIFYIFFANHSCHTE